MRVQSVNFHSRSVRQVPPVDKRRIVWRWTWKAESERVENVLSYRTFSGHEILRTRFSISIGALCRQIIMASVIQFVKTKFVCCLQFLKLLSKICPVFSDMVWNVCCVGAFCHTRYMEVASSASMSSPRFQGISFKEMASLVKSLFWQDCGTLRSGWWERHDDS